MAGEKPATSYGRTPIPSVHPDGSWMGGNGPIGSSYDNVEFNLATGQTDYDVDTNQSDAFSNITTANYVEIRSDKTKSQVSTRTVVSLKKYHLEHEKHYGDKKNGSSS